MTSIRDMSPDELVVLVGTAASEAAEKYVGEALAPLSSELAAVKSELAAVKSLPPRSEEEKGEAAEKAAELSSRLDALEEAVKALPDVREAVEAAVDDLAAGPKSIADADPVAPKSEDKFRRDGFGRRIHS